MDEEKITEIAEKIVTHADNGNLKDLDNEIKELLKKPEEEKRILLEALIICEKTENGIALINLEQHYKDKPETLEQIREDACRDYILNGNTKVKNIAKVVKTEIFSNILLECINKNNTQALTRAVANYNSKFVIGQILNYAKDNNTAAINQLRLPVTQNYFNKPVVNHFIIMLKQMIQINLF